ncbi:undecaprenyl-diphosphatase [Aeromicrobium panaciterrae]|uniref:Undecaprenyl-diphosphatase n=1 Tax=Aeromicrobium panaciterrae TaxID=363861 RepID=A0ABU1US28_9ACTN|nr:phosphatase PAP2 family protein [Aeromicrobium panaciterrae]MDR7087955.1 undecaprenyl-diphosphatase [Aeromicrobium panaciterrae]
MRSDSFDERLLRWIDGHQVDALTSFSKALMDVSEASGFWMAVGLIGLVVVVYRRAWRVGLAVGLASYLGGLVSGQLKEIIERPRPTYPDALVQVGGYAMPSSHACFLMAVSIAVLIVVEWRPRRALVLAATGFVVVQLLIAVSMVYLGAHWATDVFAGWALGVPIGLLCGLVFRKRARSA